MKILSLLIIALGANYSFAGDHNEAVWQAHGGGNVIHTGYTYSSVGLESDDLTIDTKENIHRVSLDYERGLNDMLSLNLGLDYISQDDNKSSNHGAGIEHVQFLMKGNHHLGSAGLYFGLNSRFGLSRRVVDSADNSNNASLGRMEFTPYLALNLGNRNLGYGLKVSYQYNTNFRTDEDDNDTEFEGGNTLAGQIYFESSFTDKSLLGIAVNYSMTEATNLMDTEVNIEGKLNSLRFDFYGAVDCGCDKMKSSFLPKFSYYMNQGEDSSSNIDLRSAGGSYAIEMALRTEF